MAGQHVVDSPGRPALKQDKGFVLLAVLGVSLALFLYALAAVHHLIGVQARLKAQLRWPLQLITFQDSLSYRDLYGLPSTIRDLTSSVSLHPLAWRQYSWQQRIYTVRQRQSWSTDVALRVENALYPLVFNLANDVRGIVQIDRDDVFLRAGSGHMKEARFRVGGPWDGAPCHDPHATQELARQVDGWLAEAEFAGRQPACLEDSLLHLSGQILFFPDSLCLRHCTVTGQGLLVSAGSISLEGCKLMRGVSLVAGDRLWVDDSSSVSESWLHAEMACEVGGVALGYNVVTTFGHLNIRPRSRWRGQNDLIVLPARRGQAPQGRWLHVQEDVSLEGNLFFLSDEEPTRDGGIQVAASSTMTGLLLSETWAGMMGRLRGSLVTRRLGFLDDQGARTSSDFTGLLVLGPTGDREFSLPPLFTSLPKVPRHILEER